MLRLHTLGALRLERDGEPLLPGRRKELALLAYVARRAPRECSRDELAELLWGERDGARARHSLRQVLLHLRQVLDGGTLDVAGERVALRADVVELDATAFERDVAGGQYADAVGRWRGDFLPGVEDVGGPAFRAWLEQEREWLRRRLGVAFSRLTTGAARTDQVAALRWAEQWSHAFPWDEDAMRHVLQALARQGRGAEARARLDAFARACRAELGADPSPDLASAAAVAPIVTPPPATVPPTAPVAITVVEGEPGAERDRRAARVAAEARGGDARATMLEARADATTRAVPWTAARALLAGIAAAPGLPDAPNRALGELAALVPALRERFPHLATASGDPAAVAGALHDVLCVVAARVPVVLLVHEAADADEATQALLASLVRRMPPSVRLVLAVRPGELADGPLAGGPLGAALASVATSPASRRVVLAAPPAPPRVSSPPPKATMPAPEPPRARRRLRVALAGAAVATALVLLALALPRVRTAAAPQAARAAVPAPAPKRVLVAAFVNQSGDSALDPLGRIGAEWLADGLAKTGLARVVPLAFTGEPRAADSGVGADAPARARALASGARADLVVSGAYTRYGDTLRFVGRIVDVRTGELLTVVDDVSGDGRVPMAVIETLRRRTLGALAPHLDGRLAAWAREQSVPPSYDAYVEFARGLTLLGARKQQALDHFLAAYRLDTTYTLPLLYAAGMCATTSCFWTGDSLVRTLMPRRERLAPFDRSLLDFYAARFRGDLNGQLAVAREALEIAPTAVSLVYGAAAAAVSLNRPAEAAEVLASVDLDGPLDLAPTGIWNYAAAAAHMLGDYEKQLDVGRTVRRRMPADVRYLLYEARALAAMGRLRELEAVLEESKQNPNGAGSALPAFWVHIAAHDELVTHGQSPRAARALLERLLEFYRDPPPSLRAEPLYAIDVAHVLLRLGRLAEARALYERALVEHPRGWSGADGERAAMLMWTAYTAALQGDRARVAAIRRELQAAAPRTSEFGQQTQFLGFIAAALGERAEAMRLLKRAAAEGRRFDSFTHAQHELAPLRGYAPFEDWVRPKG